MKKKLIALLVVLTICASMFAGCGDGSSDDKKTTAKQEETKGTEKGTEENQTDDATTTEGEPEEPVKLTIWVQEKLRVMDWETNAMTKWLEEQGNFDLEFVVIPSADYKTKIAMALTVGDIEELPDIIFGSFTNNNLYDYGVEAETILPLTDYYNDPELAVNINEAIERVGFDYTKLIGCIDGNIYGIATVNQSYGNEYPDKLWIYKPWLDKLGEEIPTTTEEYYQLLKKVAATDLNGNGKNDEIGLAGAKKTYTGYFDYLMNSFVYGADPNQRLIENGELTYAFTKDEWKEGLKYIHKLYDEKLLLAESLTMDANQFKTLVGGETPTVFSFVYMAPSVATDAENYICVAPLTGPEGVSFATYTPASASVQFVVTANCKNPEAAFRLGDLMCSETMSISQRWGQEGVDWDYAKNVSDTSKYISSVPGFDLSIVAYDDATFWSGKDAQNSSYLQTGPYVRHYAIANGVAVDPESNTLLNQHTKEGQVLYQTCGKQPKDLIMGIIYNEEENEIVAGDLGVSLRNYVTEFKGAAISGNIDIDAEWDNY